MSTTIVNGLTIEQLDNGQFRCLDLKSLPKGFAEKWSAEEVKQAIDQHLLVIRGQAEKRFPTDEERKAVDEKDRMRLGAELFDAFIPKFRDSLPKFEKLMDELLFWLSDWWYYNAELVQKVREVDRGAIHKSANELVKKMVLPIFPEPVIKRIQNGGFTPNATAVRFGHFAFLFGNRDRGPEDRLVITDTQLFEMSDVGGYVYLDLLPSGMPLTRSCCSRGGERAFFDGQRLMSHDRFQTCAPKPGFFPGGYIVNSTECSIINGGLYPLLRQDDKVAHTTGAFFGMVDWTLSEFMASWQMADDTAGRLRFEDGKVLHDGQKLKPIGFFQTSPMKLLDNGFVRVDWAEFQETGALQCSHIAAVDDRQEWLDQVRGEFAGEVDRFDELRSTDKLGALTWIREHNPEVLLLDVHLTALEEFDGLWIANQLTRGGFMGRILLCSSYKDEALRAMRVLVRHERTEAPGKDLKKIRAVLSRI